MEREGIARVKVSLLGGDCQGQGQSPGFAAFLVYSLTVPIVPLDVLGDHCGLPHLLGATLHGLLFNCSSCSSRCSW